MVFARQHVEFGDAYQHQVVRQSFAFENPSGVVVSVVEAVALSGDGSVHVVPERIPPGGRGEVIVEQALGGRLGRAGLRYRVVTDEPGGPRYRLQLSGFVQSAYDPDGRTVDFRAVDRRAGGNVEFDLQSREVARLELRGVEHGSEWVEFGEAGRAGVAEEGLRIRAKLLPGAPEGYLSGTGQLRTNVEHQPLVTVPWRAVVLGDVRPSENPVRLGVLETGRAEPHTVELRSSSGAPVRVARVEVPAPLLFTVADCGPACARLDLRVADTDHGPLAGEIVVHLAGGSGPITLRYSGISVAPGTRIKRVILDPEAAAAEGAEGEPP